MLSPAWIMRGDRTTKKNRAARSMSYTWTLRETSRLSTCWQRLSRLAIQQRGYGSVCFRQVCCTMQQTGHTRGISAEYLTGYFLAIEICDRNPIAGNRISLKGNQCADSKRAADRFNASVSAES
jgi:hypothetical protein